MSRKASNVEPHAELAQAAESSVVAAQTELMTVCCIWNDLSCMLMHVTGLSVLCLGQHTASTVLVCIVAYSQQDEYQIALVFTCL